MQNRETGKTYKKSPMGGIPNPEKNDLVYRKALPSKADEFIDKLATVYNSKAFGNANAPLVGTSTNYIEPLDGGNYLSHTAHLDRRNGGRIGFIGKDTDVGGVAYRAGHDLGDPDRGVLDVTLNTPMGNISRGYEGETDYVSYETPRAYQSNGLDVWYNNNFDHPIEMSAGRAVSDATGGNLFYADAKMPISQERYGDINTPIGNLSYGTIPGNNGYAYADYTPNEQMDYYIQALANLLNR